MWLRNMIEKYKTKLSELAIYLVRTYLSSIAPGKSFRLYPVSAQTSYK